MHTVTKVIKEFHNGCKRHEDCFTCPFADCKVSYRDLLHSSVPLNDKKSNNERSGKVGQTKEN